MAPIIKEEWEIQIMKEAGTLNLIKIIAIPIGMEKNKAKKEVLQLLKII